MDWDYSLFNLFQVLFENKIILTFLGTFEIYKKNVYLAGEIEF